MSLLRPFTAQDLFSVNPINLDAWTETYGVAYYLGYLNNWGECFSVVTTAHPSEGELMGYVMGKTEGVKEDWHCHVSAITVSPSHRRLALATNLMKLLQTVAVHENNYFVDLFVRESNLSAIKLYTALGYVVWRRVKGYYGGNSVGEADEDAFDMRKALPRDVEGLSVKLPKGKKSGRDVITYP